MIRREVLLHHHAETAPPGSNCNVQQTLRTLVIVALLPISTACQTKTGQTKTSHDALLGTRAGNPGPPGDGKCDFDLTGDKADTVFFVLGALDEYLGRHIVEDGDVVAHFYCSERDTAVTIRRQVVTLAGEQGLDPHVREESGPDCGVVFHSKSVADRLNSCYSYSARIGALVSGDDGTMRRFAEASLGIKLFEKEGSGRTTEAGWPESVFHRRRALAYLAGAWMRYHRNKDFVFANAQSKAALVAELLHRLCCHQIRIESTIGRIPQANIVHFEPTEEVKAWLEKTW
jgi:hypothetical protein